jgi:hypothetical protein
VPTRFAGEVAVVKAEIERLMSKFDYITDLALEFYDIDYDSEDGVAVGSLDQRFESRRGTIQEILDIASEEVTDDDENQR